ncbi:MAG: HEAT repeat domain-containing protein [Pyrinomonadaceae bacterium]|jgi:HEAT repeat protein
MKGLANLAFTVFIAIASAAAITAQTAGSLSASIDSPDPEARRTAIYRLRLDCQPASIRPAIILADDRLPVVRASAAPLFACLPPSEAEPVLARLLSDKVPFVRKEAAYAFGLAAEPFGSETLIAAFNRESDMEVKSAIIVSLGITGKPDSFSLLVNVLQNPPTDDNRFLRRSAARSIGQIAQRLATGNFDRTTPESFLPDKYLNLKPVRAGIRFPVLNNAVPVLERIAMAENEDDDTRREAIFALGIIGSDQSVAAIKRAYSSSDPFLSQIARESLFRSGFIP